MFIIKYKKIFLGISITLVVLSLLALAVFGLKLGIDFKGGALLEVVYQAERPTQEDLAPSLEALNFGAILLQPTHSKESQGRPEQNGGTTGDLGYIVKSRALDDAEHILLLDALKGDEQNILTEMNFNSVGPSVGRELTRKALVAIVLILLLIICFIAFSFRGVSKPVSSWRYGLIAIATLFHDVLIPIGIFVSLSHYYGAEVDTLFVVAVLTILGLSVSDTIVIFDRIRENLKEQSGLKNFNFSETVGRSLSQSYVRSISTSFTVILVLLALFFFGPVSTKYFALMLTAGMFFGTYSSIFLASPLLVFTEEWQKRK